MSMQLQKWWKTDVRLGFIGLKNTIRSVAVTSVVACGVLTSGVTLAAPFEVAVSPSRFELSSEKGKRLGQSLTIYNVGNQDSEVSLRTLDWTYSEAGQVSYFDELQPNSCRPWVALERRKVKIPARSDVRFRFQIDVPKDAPSGECKFMLAIEGVDSAYEALIKKSGMSMSLPVSGRIAVAVYVAVDGAKPKLEMQKVGLQTVNGKQVPAVVMANTGEAHGRLNGALEATDANGKSFELVVDGSPIMAGQTRVLPFTAKMDAPASVVKKQSAQPKPVLPYKAKGLLEWDGGGFSVDTEFK